jgi:ATP-dependent Clp protease ATP-binding subunit ClpB
MATTTKLVQNEKLDTQKRSSTSRRFEEQLRRRVIGQGEALRAIVDLYQVFCARLNPPRWPVGNLLFLGPTGSGRFTC